ncbi:MAG: hypothetical protein ACLT4C_02445 [Butyricicoccus sp.]
MGAATVSPRAALLRVLLPEPALPRVPVLLQPVPVREPRRSVLRLPTLFYFYFKLLAVKRYLIFHVSFSP